MSYPVPYSWVVSGTLLKDGELFTQGKVLEKKKIAAEIKIDYNKKQTENLEREIEHKDEIYNHLCEKYSNKELYGWLKKETGTIYKTLFQLAVKVARKAEKCYHFEIGDTDENPQKAKTFIKGSGSYWNGLHSGLLAGEKLLADLHAMEVAYLENDRNELEITRPVSLKEIAVENTIDSTENEVVLNEIKNLNNWTTDNKKERMFCSVSFNINENVFFNDFLQPHTFGRIRDVKLLVCSDSADRLSAELNMDQNVFHTKNGNIENRIGVQTFASSTVNSECGKFDFNFKTDKFYPFEGAGIDSHWVLTLSAPLGYFPSTITDVILQISYTARNG